MFSASAFAIHYLVVFQFDSICIHVSISSVPYSNALISSISLCRLVPHMTEPGVEKRAYM